MITNNGFELRKVKERRMHDGSGTGGVTDETAKIAPKFVPVTSAEIQNEGRVYRRITSCNKAKYTQAAHVINSVSGSEQIADWVPANNVNERGWTT